MRPQPGAANALKGHWAIRRFDGGWRAVFHINGQVVLRSDPYGQKDEVRKMIARAKHCAGTSLVHEED